MGRDHKNARLGHVDRDWWMHCLADHDIRTSKNKLTQRNFFVHLQINSPRVNLIPGTVYLPRMVSLVFSRFVEHLQEPRGSFFKNGLNSMYSASKKKTVTIQN
jgi:hypothetical protein